jgi:hypothetical protein
MGAWLFRGSYSKRNVGVSTITIGYCWQAKAKGALPAFQFAKVHRCRCPRYMDGPGCRSNYAECLVES